MSSKAKNQFLLGKPDVPVFLLLMTVLGPVVDLGLISDSGP